LENNHTNRYLLKLSNETVEYSCELYYDTLYDKAYIAKDGGLYEASTDFARYIDSFLENRNINIYIDNADAVELFKKYGWTLDYQINAMENKLNDIKHYQVLILTHIILLTTTNFQKISALI